MTTSTNAQTAEAEFRAKAYDDPKQFRKGVRNLAERHSADYVLQDHVYTLTFRDGSQLQLSRELVGLPAIAVTREKSTSDVRGAKRERAPRGNKDGLNPSKYQGPPPELQAYIEAVKATLRGGPMTETRIKPSVVESTFMAFSLASACQRKIPAETFITDILKYISKWFSSPESWGVENSLVYFGPFHSQKVHH